MTVKFQNIPDWEQLESGNSLVLDGREGPRRIRMKFNAEKKIVVMLQRDDMDDFPLAVGEGLLPVEFVGQGQVKLYVACADPAVKEAFPVWWFTPDGTNTSVEIPDAEAFVKIAERRARNPEFELMQWKANQNIEKRLRRAEAELAAKWEALNIDPNTGEIIKEPKRPPAGSGDTETPKASGSDDGQASASAPSEGDGASSGQQPEGDKSVNEPKGSG
jgi:hypothetical protein